ncbi:MAG: hypothetical protein ACLP0J_20665 [Solirubrobacteraceae bacterium]
MGADRALVNMDEISAYERLARMIERELELVSQSRFRELLQAVERRSNFHATLPVPHSEAAQPAFERARQLHELVVIETRRCGECLGQSLAKLRAVSRAAKRYAGPRRHRYSASA